MRTNRRLLAVIALSASVAYPAMGNDCRFAAAVNGRLVVLLEDGSVSATLAEGAQGRWAAAWSPGGEHLLYSAVPQVHGDPIDIHLAKADGTELGALRVTAAESRNYDIEFIREVQWLDESTFWYYARVGHLGAYVDVWKIAPQFARSKLAARLGVAGGPCSLAPDQRLLACVAEDRLANEVGISVFKYREGVTGEPLPEVGTAENAEFVRIRNASPKDAGDARVEGGLHWRNAGQLMFAVRRGETLELGTLDLRRTDPKAWIMDLQRVAGVDGLVRTIRTRDGSSEIVTEQGSFAIAHEPIENPASRSIRQVLTAQRLAAPGFQHSAGQQAAVLDRWCSR